MSLDTISTLGYVVSKTLDLSTRDKALSDSTKLWAPLPLSKFQESGSSLPDGVDATSSVVLSDGSGNRVPAPDGPFVAYLSSSYDGLASSSPEFASSFRSALARYKCTFFVGEEMYDEWMFIKNEHGMTDFYGNPPELWCLGRAAGSTTRIEATPLKWTKFSFSDAGCTVTRKFFPFYSETGSAFLVVTDETVSSGTIPDKRRFAGDPDRKLINLGSIQEGTRGATSVGGSPRYAGHLVQLSSNGMVDESMLPSNYTVTEEYVQNAIAEAVAPLNEHVEDRDNPHEVTKGQIGLGNVDNTSDMDKPVSTATQQAIDDALGDLASVLRYRGSVPTYDDLPTSNVEIGDVWNVQEDDMNVACVGFDCNDEPVWDPLGASLSLYLTKQEASDTYATKTDATLTERSGYTDWVLTGVGRTLTSYTQPEWSSEASEWVCSCDINGQSYDLTSNPGDGSGATQDSVSLNLYEMGEGDLYATAVRSANTGYILGNSLNNDKPLAKDVDLQAHVGRTDNPHGVTGQQVGVLNSSGKVDENLVVESSVTNGSITNSKLATNAVNGAKIANLSVSTGKLTNGAVSTAKIADGAVTAAKIDQTVLGGLATKADATLTEAADAWVFANGLLEAARANIGHLVHSPNHIGFYNTADPGVVSVWLVPDDGTNREDFASAILSADGLAANMVGGVDWALAIVPEGGTVATRSSATGYQLGAQADKPVAKDADLQAHVNNSTIHVTAADKENWNGKVGTMESVTWAQLKAKRDGGTLVPGQQYRITDYVAKTTQTDTQSSNHPFDIIVTADAPNKLNEIARATIHSGDTYFANAGCKLEAWKVWYCLDNDTDRFAWADTTNGKGVVYRLIDEFYNDCPYDFKGIQFKAYGDTDNVFRYTFDDGEPADNKDNSLSGFFIQCNKIAPYTVAETNGISLNNIVFKGWYTYNNTFANDCSNNTLGDGCNNNTFGSNCYSNTFSSGCQYNTFGGYCHDNTFGLGCQYNTFDSGCYSNPFGDECTFNTLDSGCYSNTFGSYCSNNMLGSRCNNINLKPGTSASTAANHNSFGDNCSQITLWTNSINNSFGNNCQSITLGLSSNNGDCQNNSFGNSCNSIWLGHKTYSCSFGNGCSFICFGSAAGTANTKRRYQYISFEDGVQHILLNRTSADGSNYYQNVLVTRGINNTTTYKTISDANYSQTYRTVYQAPNSQVISFA